MVERKSIIVLTVVSLMLFSPGAFAGTYSGGTGEPNDPYLIATAEDMNEIGANPADWDKHFLLTANIDLSALKGTSYNIIGYYLNEHSYRLFTGAFDGNGHTMSNFTYSSTGVNEIGLFGIVGGNGEIKNLGLMDPNIDAGTGVGIGSLVGYMDSGTITNCYVLAGDVSGDMFVGGFIGLNRGTVRHCYVLTGNVLASDYVGGFVGENYDGTIDQCFSAGTIAGNRCIGGMVGVNVDDSLISNCYSTYTASGDDRVGGLVGSNGGTILNCYAAGEVSGAIDVGQLVGSDKSGSYANCFWDTTANPSLTAVGNTNPDPNGIIGKTTAGMKKQDTFAEATWDFVEIWNIGEN